MPDIFDPLDDFILLRILKLSDPLLFYIPRLVCRRWSVVYEMKGRRHSTRARFEAILMHDDIKQLKLIKANLPECAFYEYAIEAEKRVNGRCDKIWQIEGSYERYYNCEKLFLDEMCRECRDSLLKYFLYGHQSAGIEYIIKRGHNKCLRSRLATLRYKGMYDGCERILEYTVTYGDKETLKLLLDYFGLRRVRDQEKCGKFRLCSCAARTGNIETLSYLFGSKFPVNKNVLESALYSGKVESVRYILENCLPNYVSTRTDRKLWVLVYIMRNSQETMDLFREYWGKERIDEMLSRMNARSADTSITKK